MSLVFPHNLGMPTSAAPLWSDSPVHAAIRVLIASACALTLTAPADAALVEHVLSNGMKVIVKEDRRAPVVVSMVWYRAGSMDEKTGTTGVAHVLEHMMFKGTRSLGPGEYSRTVAVAGGRDNAFTNRDYTAYYQQQHKSNLVLALELEADRMANLQLADTEFAKEIKVVMEERRMRTDDQPRALLYERLLSMTWQAHPYRTPVVGWMNDLENMRVDDAREWYRAWYAPNNATLVVVGDVSAQEVVREAERLFGPIPARALPVRRPMLEPAQNGIRRAMLKAPAELPYLLMAWHVPALADVNSDRDAYALWALAALLDGGDAARLPRELVRGSRVAVSAGASYDAISRGPSLFVLKASPSPGRTVQETEAALREQLRRIAQDGVGEDEMARVRAQVVAGQVYQLDSMFSQAMQIGALDNAGLPPDSVQTQARRLQEVTAAQVQDVVRRYLGDDNLTVAVLDPQPVPARPGARAGAPAGELE
jgi:zinc protease